MSSKDKKIYSPEEYSEKLKEKKNLVDTALGLRKADIVLKNAKIINVFTNQIVEGDIALYKDRIAGIGSYEGMQEIDLKGKYVVPGLIEAHFHIESSMVIPARLSPVLLQHGICTVVADPHEIVNAAGKLGMDYMIEDAKKALLDYFFMIPSSVPSCDFEVNGAGEFEAGDMEEYLEAKNVLGLAEVMRMLDVLNSNPKMSDKLMLFEDKIIDGHAPGLKGKSLQAYKAGGIMNDHEASSYEEALERLQCGFHLFIREGSGAKNLEGILPGLLKNHIPLDHCSFCTDDKHIEDIFEEGTIDHEIRKAVSLGCPFIEAVKMATINTARHYKLKDRGAIAPGYLADLVVLSDLDSFKIESVFKNGKEADFKDAPGSNGAKLDEKIMNSVHLPEIQEKDLKLSMGKQPVIELVKDQLYTNKVEAKLNDRNFPSQQYNLLAAAERYGKTGEAAFCALSGFNLKSGAIAMSYAHDSHNAIAVSDNKKDLLLALKTLQEIQGGIVLIENGKIYDALAMEAAGMMSTKDAKEIADRIEKMKDKIRKMGVPEGIDPFANLSFLSLPVIPEIRLCPQGLFDVKQHKFINKNK